ncbi:glycine oxidase ThiO [Metabacillus halosaccharovorans]|uniref:glycine oxidase ThiO n=1 Tax=Metabacillus halosaccharovorans TaxID=930124 RepID=UPI00203DF8CC|nr:glycine oxidase ThiO [Metabacillus halosaccharovorans]MCM3442366.1 glycine oxidase ThiO [Metabacillus halosaccharovorans]
MSKHFDVGIVGGGIIGQSIAYQLAKEGISVLVLDRHKGGSGATSAAAGMLGANSELEQNDAFFQFAKESQRQYHLLQDELSNFSQIHIQLVDKGMYKIALSQEEAIALKKAVQHHEALEWHTRETVLNHEPSVSSEIEGALHIPEDGHVSPIHVCEAFTKSASLLGATFIENAPVQSVKKTSVNDYILSTPQGDFTCNKVVIANGVWSGYFFKQLGLPNGMKPVKGECLAVKSNTLHLEKTIFYDHCYIVPKGDGRFVVGATMVEDDWSTTPSLGGIHALIEKVSPLVPGISSAQLISTWAGLRPQSEDGKPYIGVHPEDDNILFATGHYRNGILLAPKTGTMIRDFILKKKIDENYVRAFSVTRNLAQSNEVIV